MPHKADADSSSSSGPSEAGYKFVAVNKMEWPSQAGSTIEGHELPLRIAGLFGHNPQQNLLLGALPLHAYERLAPHLELVSMQTGMVLAEGTRSSHHVFFPTSCIVSLLHETPEGSALETAVIGSEGMVGIAHCLGGGTMTGRFAVKCAGYGFRLRASIFRQECERGEELSAYVLRFTQALLSQLSQTAVCNRHHCIMQQFCRWLLQCIDRLGAGELCMTQEAIAHMLGVRRESVAEAAGKLQDSAVIHYSRGRIHVLDRAGLEQRACECYFQIRQEYERLLPVCMDGTRGKGTHG